MNSPAANQNPATDEREKMNALNPKKLLQNKWTAVKTNAKQKHFLLSRGVHPDYPTVPIEQAKIQAVFSQAAQVIAFRELQDNRVSRQGWV